mgnify:CR=1 FL=1
MRKTFSISIITALCFTTLIMACKKDVDIVPDKSNVIEAVDTTTKEPKTYNYTNYFSFDSEKWVMVGLYQDKKSSNGGEYKLELTRTKDTVVRFGAKTHRFTKLEGVEHREGLPDEMVNLFYEIRRTESKTSLVCWNPSDTQFYNCFDSVFVRMTNEKAIQFHGKTFWSYVDIVGEKVVWGASIIGPNTLNGLSKSFLRPNYLFRNDQSLYIVKEDTLVIY